MSKDGKSVEVDGTIKQVLAGTMFKVEIAGGREVLAHISGKMRKRFIRLVAGDAVGIRHRFLLGFKSVVKSFAPDVPRAEPKVKRFDQS